MSMRFSLVFFAVAALALAQEAPPSSTATPAASPSPIASPPDVPVKQPTTDTSAALDYLFNRKPQEGSAGKQALDAGRHEQDRIAAEEAIGFPRQGNVESRARFERYLGAAEVPKADLDDYFARMKKASDLLRDNRLFEAWKKLYDLAEDQRIDAGVSRELANRIESIWNTGRASSALDQRNEKLRKDIKTANANADLMSDQVMDKEIEYQRKTNKTGQQQQKWQRDRQLDGGVPPLPAGPPGSQPDSQSITGLEGKLQLTEEYLRSLELKARIKLNELKQEKLLEQAKADFAEYISTLFNSGRLNHVVLAADFYRKIFQESEYPADMARQVNASLEINRDVAATVEVFRYKLDRDQLSGAAGSLRQASATSELNAAVLGLERPLKEKVADFNAQLDRMRNLIEARDFGNLQELLENLKKSAPDFDTTKPAAIVNAVKLESKMRLGKARLYAQQGDLKAAMEEFQAAAQAWPGNPDLEDKALTFFHTQDVKSQALAEFDRLVEEQNARAIFDKQLAFAPAVKGDSRREEALKRALETIRNAEAASGKAGAMMMNGDVFGAWETIELAAADLPDDKKLNKLRADLSGRSAEFVSAINKARDAEGRNETGFSLTWYVNAQRQYPASQIANQGIARLSKKVLEEKM